MSDSVTDEIFGKANPFAVPEGELTIHFLMYLASLTTLGHVIDEEPVRRAVAELYDEYGACVPPAITAGKLDEPIRSGNLDFLRDQLAMFAGAAVSSLTARILRAVLASTGNSVRPVDMARVLFDTLDR